jgi:hypothetical protein
MRVKEILNEMIVRPMILENWMSDDLVLLAENGGAIFEMANLRSGITDLPANIILWTRPQPNELPHTKYRMKVTKDHKHCVTFSISSEPTVLETPRVSKKYKLDNYEKREIERFIRDFSSLLISYIDAKIDVDELEYQIQKINKGASHNDRQKNQSK